MKEVEVNEGIRGRNNRKKVFSLGNAFVERPVWKEKKMLRVECFAKAGERGILGEKNGWGEIKKENLDHRGGAYGPASRGNAIKSPIPHRKNSCARGAPKTRRLLFKSTRVAAGTKKVQQARRVRERVIAGPKAARFRILQKNSRKADQRAGVRIVFVLKSKQKKRDGWAGGVHLPTERKRVH